VDNNRPTEKRCCTRDALSDVTGAHGLECLCNSAWGVFSRNIIHGDKLGKRQKKVVTWSHLILQIQIQLGSSFDVGSPESQSKSSEITTLKNLDSNKIYELTTSLSTTFPSHVAEACR